MDSLSSFMYCQAHNVSDSIIYSGMRQMRLRLASVLRRLKLQIFHITWFVAYQNA